MRISVRPAMAALVMLLATAPAAATQYTYVFDTHLINNSYASAGIGRLVSTVGSGTNSAGVTITNAQAFTAVKAGTNVNISTSTLAIYDGGLGVVSPTYDSMSGCGSTPGGCNMHQIDNVGNSVGSTAYDFIQLTFSQAVTLTGMTRYAFPQTDVSPAVYDDDASYGNATTLAESKLGISAPTPVTVNSDGSVNSRTWSQFSQMLDGELDNNGPCTPDTSAGGQVDGYSVCKDSTTWSKATSSYNASSPYTASTTWWISASILNPDKKPDAFKLYDFTVVYNDVVASVPEPASWMTMIAGFGFIGAALRRRRAVAGLAPA